MRKSGILLPIFSLPSAEGIGTLGSEAVHFVDFLAEAGQKLWQVLPLGPAGYGNSPYQSYSAYAGNPLLISLEYLSEAGLIPIPKKYSRTDTNKVDYQAVEAEKMPLLIQAAQNFILKNEAGIQNEYQDYIRSNPRISEYALFIILKKYFGGIAWTQWDKPYKIRDEKALSDFMQEHSSKIEEQKVLQYFFYQQWQTLKKYANEKGIQIIGDMPIYPSPDSVEVWSQIHLFQYDNDFVPKAVAGVPPDYFSPEGQLWGNPLYDWEADGIFDWWVERVKHDLEMFDILRIDHFRGLESYWAVPFGDKTAMNGSWKPARAYELLNRLKEEVGLENIIAEDLGIITHAVEKLRDDFQLPGMKILQFAFTAGYESTYLPHRINKNSVIFTGTHDNDTTRGWHDSEERSKADKKFATDYLNCNDADITKAMIRAAWASRAKIAIAPMQDFLNLGTEARINTPGVLGDNWQWRMHKAALSDKLSAEIKHITELYFR